MSGQIFQVSLAWDDHGMVYQWQIKLLINYDQSL